MDQNTNLYTLAVSAVVFLLGVLNTVGLGILRGLKKNDETLFGRANRTDQRVTQATTQIDNIIEDVREIKINCKDNHRSQK